MEDETLVIYGGEVKALEGGKVGGYLVRFSTPDDPDLTGDYFDASTDFGEATTAPVLYQHGMDTKMGRRKIGRGEMRRDDVGMWIEAQLEMRDEYEKAIYQLAQDGKLGWSSGTAGHLVEREAMGKATLIKSWPLGLDASLTPTPAEPRNSAVTLKSLFTVDNTPDAAGAVAPTAEPEPTDETKTQPVSGDIEMDEQEFDTLKSDVAELKELLKNEPATKAAPVVLKTGLGDTETKAYCHFLRTGQENSTVKASNATDMNIGTDADGGYTVPVGHYAGIIARRDEAMLRTGLGLMQVPGQGTTVNVPVDDEDDGEFIATTETSDFDVDAPALNTKAFTLVKYTKDVKLSVELLRDTDANLMAFLNNFVGRGMAKTHNSLLITAAAAGGTALKTFASSSAFALGELEAMVYNAALGSYLDGGNVSWIMQAPTYGKIISTGSTSIRLYGENAQGSVVGPTLLGYGVKFSAKVAAVAASAKSVFFGNWSYMGYREGNGFTVLRDPYSLASKGQVVLHYYFDAVYGALQAEAFGYGVHPTA